MAARNTSSSSIPSAQVPKPPEPLEEHCGSDAPRGGGRRLTPALASEARVSSGGRGNDGSSNDTATIFLFSMKPRATQQNAVCDAWTSVTTDPDLRMPSAVDGV